jgi:ubiquinone/menaquinone biosynthesis C-methylase UbiE
MTSIGYRTGLFDSMAELEPSTSQQIADETDLNERYVREWLGAMVTGQIVYFNPENGTYFLPVEHAAWLTRKSSPNNMAVTTQWLHVMAYVEDGIVECFQKGGGLAYDEYNRFHEVMADQSHQSVVTSLLDQLLPLAEGVREKLEKGIEVLDVGCGSGKALIKLAKEYPNSRFTGYDSSQDVIERALLEARKYGLTNLTLVVRNAAEFDDKETFDLILTLDSVHDQAKPDLMLRNIFNALKSDGTYFCQDIAGSSYVEKNMDHPIAPFMYTISCTHCMSVSLGQDGAGLGAMWGKELACQMMKKAGFSQVEVKNLEHDFMNNYYIVRK